MNRISTIKKEYLKEEFIKQIGDSYTLNLSIMLLEEFDDLEKENVTLKEDIKNLIKIISKNCNELEATEEEFESLYRWENE